jgi:hypothetical protein
MKASIKPLQRPAKGLLCVLAILALLKHPEFKAAAQFAPNFTSEVLHALAEAEKKTW